MQNKVLFVNLRLTGGGSEKVMAILASYYAEHGIDTGMLLLKDEERVYPISDKVKITECYCPRNGNRLLWHFKRISSIRKAIRESGADTVISFMWDVNMNVVLACMGLGKKVIISERADPHNSTRFKAHNFAIKWILPWADKIVFQTPMAKETYTRRSRKKGVIIPNPIVIKEDNVDENNAPCKKEIISAGRLMEQKNFEMLIQAFAIFSKEHPDYKLTIYGDGPLRGKLEDQITGLGLEDKVSLPGFVSDLNDRMKQVKIYASSSDYEGISNAMLEALAAGLPSVCTDCPVGGAAMAIEDHVSGILVKVGDAEGMAKAFAEIADDEKFAGELSEKAREKMREFRIDNVARRWMEL